MPENNVVADVPIDIRMSEPPIGNLGSSQGMECSVHVFSDNHDMSMKVTDVALSIKTLSVVDSVQLAVDASFANSKEPVHSDALVVLSKPASVENVGKQV
ncbi:hypothetical protein ACLB2K_053149 [Fragaria x ananassa]